MITLALFGVVALGGFLLGMLVATRFGWLSVLTPTIGYSLYHIVTSDGQNTTGGLFTRFSLFFLAHAAGMFVERRRRTLRLERHHTFGLGFVALYLLSFMNSRELGIGVTSVLFHASLIISGISLALFAPPKAQTAGLRAFLLLTIGSISLSLLFFFPNGENPLTEALFDPLSLTALQEQRRYGALPTILLPGAALIFGSTTACLLAARSTSTTQRRYLLQATILAGIALLGILQSQFRALLGGIVVGVLYTAGAIWQRPRILLLFNLALLMAAFMDIGQLDELFQTGFLSRENIFATMARSEIREVSLELFFESPLYGHGILSNSPLFYESSDFLKYYGTNVAGSHSSHFMILTEVGLVGVSLWLALFLFHIIGGLRVVRELNGPLSQSQFWSLAVLVAVSSLFFFQQFHSILFQPSVWWLLFWRYQDNVGPYASNHPAPSH